jgi:murein L,D-transpeptidase YcbB/YkuD
MDPNARVAGSEMSLLDECVAAYSAGVEPVRWPKNSLRAGSRRAGVAAVLAHLSANPTLTRTLLMNEEAAKAISVVEAKKEKARLEHEIVALVSAFSEKTGLSIKGLHLMPLVSMGDETRYYVEVDAEL